ncbi:MAG: rhodanese-like domain-containing protein [Acidimicrobiia bacterium]|nr:rhodanese-like domain-containing protein [Acidimicrobiia bacterium]
MFDEDATSVVTVTDEDFQRLHAFRSTVVLDASPTSVYRSRHIAGALNLPPSLARRLAPVLVPNKAATVVVYSQDPGSADARHLGVHLDCLGFSDVRVVDGTTADWWRWPLVLASGCA